MPEAATSTGWTPWNGANVTVKKIWWVRGNCESKGKERPNR